VKPQSYIGANNAQPVVVNNNVIYAAARGGHLREMAFNWQAGGYLTGDLSLRAPHLVDGFDIVDMAFSKAPYPIVWMVSSSGKLLGLTYVPEQQIGAWHWHDTDGVFESICVVAEGNEDVLYALVRRTINGVQKRYIERMRPRAWATQADAFHVDAGLTYTGAPATVISGLGHLEGKTVSILADGAVHRQLVVTGGTITLDNAASKVHVGLPITQTCRPCRSLGDAGFRSGHEEERQQGLPAGEGLRRISLRAQSRCARRAKIRTTEPYGSPPRLQTGRSRSSTKQHGPTDAQTCIRQSDPLPLTVVALDAWTLPGG
jgi:hypothetical protein